MKKTKIVVPALAVLLLSTAASVSGTVAWFSMNTSVTVTGMSVTTKVSSNLQIAQTNLEANYTDAITQARSGILEPASSISGADGSFYYTTAAKGDGDAKTDAYTLYNENATPALANSYAGKATHDAAFNTAYGFGTPSIRTTDDGADNVCYGYIDYSFYLKGTSSEAGQKIVMTKCNMLYNNLAITTSYAWRVGVFVTTAGANTEVNDGDVAVSGKQITILDFGSGKSANQTANIAVSGPAATGSVLHPNANAVLATLGTEQAPIQTQRYKVIVRLWLEGEDKTCTNDTYASLTESWKLDLEFKFGKNANAEDHTFDGVAKIDSVVPQQNNG